MADPHIRSPMDSFDYLSVVVYRLGFVLAAPAILLLPWQGMLPAGQLTILAGVMCASTLHIYMKSFRMLLQFASWIGLLAYMAGLPMLALGGALVTLGGLAYKEQFCFKVPGLQFQPLIVAALWFALWFELPYAAKLLASLSALLFLVLSVAKWRMPLHYDIGDKSKYEI